MKEKMEQIFNVMADITLSKLERIKAADTIMDTDDIQMVSATLQIYNFIADNQKPESLFQ